MADRQEHLTRRRQEILTAAEKVFDAHGYASTTVDAVAEEAGVAKGTLYNYFENKHDLFTQVFSEATAGSEAIVEELLVEPISAAQKLDRLLELWFELLGHHKRIGRLVLEFWANAAREDQDGSLASWFEQNYVRWQGWVADIIEEGIRTGEFHPQDDASAVAALILAMLDGVMVRAILDANTKVDRRFLESVKQAILIGIAPQTHEGHHGAEGK